MNNTSIFNMKFKGFLIGILVLVTGCEVFDLDETPKSFISPENFFKTPQQIESVLSTCQLRCFQVWRNAYDNTTLFKHDDQLAGGDLIIGQNYGSSFYALHYANVKDLNFAIASIKKGNIDGASETTINQLMGQLKFLRAWNYFQLVRMWGPLPLLTDETPDYFNQMPVRSPITDIYDLIVSDFTEAIEKLPVSWPANQVGRPAKDAAKGLLAKVYLTMATAPMNDANNYAKAAALAKEVIQAGNYSLVTDIKEVFSMATKYGPEMMWSFNANNTHRATNPKIWSGIYGWGDNSADIWWVENVYPDQPRKSAYVEIYNREGVHYTQLGNKVPGIQKYLYDTVEDFNKGISKINIPIIRYADVLLIFAEAENMAKGGPTPEAVEAVNMVINRANGYQPNPDYPLLTTSMSKEEFDAAVIDERGFELCFEYDRWFDLIRKRILREKSRPEIQNNFDEHIYLFPIPESEIRLNPNMEQNPGYGD